MEAIDLLLRGGAIGVMLLFVLAQIFGNCPPRKWLSLLALFSSVSCYLLLSSPNLSFDNRALDNTLMVIAMFTPLTLTWTALELLFDHVAGRWLWLVAAAVVSIFGCYGKFFGSDMDMQHITVSLFYLGLLIMAVLSAADDLVESRRVLRRAFVATFGALGLVIQLFEIGFEPSTQSEWTLVIQAMSFLVLSSAFAVWSLSPERSAGVLSASDTKPKANGHNSAVIRKLLSAMEEGAWKTEGLTIGSLAETIGTAEHKLRPAINQELGFRNFSTFVNSYRIEAAMSALDDEAQSERTILEIAYENGFASLGPFNRAFRQHAGLSPREYRNRQV